MQAYFRHCLVITYALPANVLQPLLPPGLSLDQYGSYGFIAVALVEVQAMRPLFVPEFLGFNCTLAGYRIFTRFTHPSGAHWRGLYILRSETNNPVIRLGGNRLTHYNYFQAKTVFTQSTERLNIESLASDGQQLQVTAQTNPAPELPSGSVFPDSRQARRFAGPLPFTFDYESQSHSIVAILGKRPTWNPVSVKVEVERCDFLNQGVFAETSPILSSAFYIKEIQYSWGCGTVYPLQEERSL